MITLNTHKPDTAVSRIKKLWIVGLILITLLFGFIAHTLLQTGEEVTENPSV